MTTPRELGSHFRAARQRAGETQHETAVSLGVTRQWLVRVEAGTGNPDLRQVLALCDHLGVHLTLLGAGRDRSQGRADAETGSTPVATSVGGDVDLDALLASFTRGAGSGANS